MPTPTRVMVKPEYIPESLANNSEKFEMLDILPEHFPSKKQRDPDCLIEVRGVQSGKTMKIPIKGLSTYRSSPLPMSLT